MKSSNKLVVYRKSMLSFPEKDFLVANLKTLLYVSVEPFTDMKSKAYLYCGMRIAIIHLKISWYAFQKVG